MLNINTHLHHVSEVKNQSLAIDTLGKPSNIMTSPLLFLVTRSKIIQEN